MMVFAVTGLLFMPILGFLFVLYLLRAIKKIINKQTYTSEVVWSGSIFALIVWTISFILVRSVD